MAVTARTPIVRLEQQVDFSRASLERERDLVGVDVAFGGVHGEADVHTLLQIQ